MAKEERHLIFIKPWGEYRVGDRLERPSDVTVRALVYTHKVAKLEGDPGFDEKMDLEKKTMSKLQEDIEFEIQDLDVEEKEEEIAEEEEDEEEGEETPEHKEEDDDIEVEAQKYEDELEKKIAICPDCDHKIKLDKGNKIKKDGSWHHKRCPGKH